MLRAQNFLSVLLVLTLAHAIHAQTAESIPKTVKVKRGQTLSLSLLTPIDSGHANFGDDVTLKLVRPLVADGATVLPAEWILHGKVTEVKRAGKRCQEGEVAWKLDRVKTPEGDQLRVQRVNSYPLRDFVASGDPVWVPLDTPLAKIGGAATFTGELAVSIVFSPLLIPMAVAATKSCAGRAGKEQSLAVGLGDLFAVSKDVRVKPIP